MRLILSPRARVREVEASAEARAVPTAPEACSVGRTLVVVLTNGALAGGVQDATGARADAGAIILGLRGARTFASDTQLSGSASKAIKSHPPAGSASGTGIT